MNFSSPQKCLQAIRAGDTSEFKRGRNREKITQSANGAPPVSEEDAKKIGMKINVNWGEMARLLSHGRRQYYNAFLKGTRFFKVTLPLAPEEKRAEWERTITDQINRPLLKSKKYFHLHQYRWTDVVVHGVASVLWEDQDDWLPRFAAREDLRIPTDTDTDFSNLGWFAYRYVYTPGELVRKVFSNTKWKWDKLACAQILKAYKNVNYDDPMSYKDWETQPEAMAELVKQNMGYYTSDAMPGIPLWHFFFEDNDGKWSLRVMPDTTAVRGTSEQDKFLLAPDFAFADSLDQILQCQFGDLNFKAPFKFHSVRSLGFELMEPCFYDNLTRCRLLQHVHENFNIWLQVTDPADKARAQAISFDGPVARVPQGVKILSEQERHQIDPGLVEMAMAQLKQLMQEASATYTQDTDTGTKKEQTAFETGVKMQQVNAMLAGLLLIAFKLEGFFMMEISRRFCRPNSTNKDVRKFQQECERLGVPKEWLNVDRWDIEVEQPIGAGNPTMEMVQAENLLKVRPMLNPTAQQEVLHDYLTVVGDAKRAARWAPMDGIKRVSDAQLQANQDFGTLMWGTDTPIRDELNPQEQIEVLLQKMAQVVDRILKTGGMAEVSEIVGLQTVGKHIVALLQRLGQNPEEKARVHQYQQVLGKLNNEIKGFMQRLQQQQKKANGEGGKLQMEMMREGLKMKQEQARFLQEQQQDSVAFQSEERRKDLAAAGDLARKEHAHVRKTMFDEAGGEDA